MLRGAAALTSDDMIAAATGEVATVTRDYDSDTRTVVIGTRLPPGYDLDRGPLFLRVWNGPARHLTARTVQWSALPLRRSPSRRTSSAADRRRGRTALGRGIRGWMEARFGSDFSGVRIHRGAAATASTRALGADAFTTGNHIVFAAGTYDPGSAGGRHVLAHELTHVVQQRSGPVSSHPIGGGVGVSHPEDAFERAAEGTARQIMARSGPPRTGTDRRPPAGMPTAAVQRDPTGTTVQRRLWFNVPARFQTENDENAPNSEYQVTATGYRRLAPVNIKRGFYDQVIYNSNNRHFLYVTTQDAHRLVADELGEEPRVQSIVGGTVMLTGGNGAPSPRPILAEMAPTEGANPFDCQVKGEGTRRVVLANKHAGHEVTALGDPLPVLDDGAALAEVIRRLRLGFYESALRTIELKKGLIPGLGRPRAVDV